MPFRLNRQVPIDNSMEVREEMAKKVQRERREREMEMEKEKANWARERKRGERARKTREEGIILHARRTCRGK